ncbi:hypothetical protein ASD80_18110 [Devosia sp. Root635]|nr:hypothetical protein ASD80_18110 [Devosia sp. Root635]
MGGSSIFFTSPFGGEVALKGRVRGPLPGEVRGEGPLTRPKRVDLSPKGEVALARQEYLS